VEIPRVNGPTSPEDHDRGAPAEAHPAVRPRRASRARAALAPALNLALFGLALWAVDHVLREYRYADVAHALADIPVLAMGAALLSTFLGYLALVGYDWVAFRFAGLPLPFRSMIRPSFVSFAVANSAPANVLTAGGVRFRLYEGRGLTPGQATLVAGLNVVTYAVGLSALAGVALILRGVVRGGGAAGPPLPGPRTGAFLLAGVAAYLLLARLRRSPVHVGRRELHLPSARSAAWQLFVSCSDWIFSSGALYVLLVAVAPVPYLQFMATFFVAQVAVLVLPIPGGVGVFEAVVLLLRPSDAAAPEVLAALLAYRVVYFLLPLVVAGALLALSGYRRLRGEARPWAALGARLSSAMPLLLSLITLVSGALLLVGGAIPAGERRVAWLTEVLPLAVIATSHFLASVVGAALVVLAWGLERRVRLAYQLVRVLFALGILLSLTRSLGLGTAGLFVAVLLLLQAAGRHFPRPVSLAREPLSWFWMFAIGSVLLTTIWLDAFVLPAEVSGEVWWRFALHGSAPRYLRAAVGIGMTTVLMGLARLLARQAPPAEAG
jgi:phosphatidylglycerol lysyltransferase